MITLLQAPQLPDSTARRTVIRRARALRRRVCDSCSRPSSARASCLYHTRRTRARGKGMELAESRSELRGFSAYATELGQAEEVGRAVESSRATTGLLSRLNACVTCVVFESWSLACATEQGYVRWRQSKRFNFKLARQTHSVGCGFVETSKTHEWLANRSIRHRTEILAKRSFCDRDFNVMLLR